MTTPVERSKWFGLIGDLVAGNSVPARGGTEVHGCDVAEAVARLLAAPGKKMAGRCFNCSDHYVSARQIAAIVRDYSGRPVQLPQERPDAGAFNIMDCTRLAELGMTFGGTALLRQTVEALTDHHLQTAG